VNATSRTFAGMLAIALASAACLAPRASAPAASGTGTAIQVSAREYQFQPAALTVKAGDVTFEVTNVGATTHEFEVLQGTTTVDEMEGLVPGSTHRLTVTLAAGEYSYVCKIAGHDSLGMKGTITVTAD